MIIEAKKQIPEKKSEWLFVRKNSKGENIFRRETNQTAEHAATVLNNKEIAFVYSDSGSCFRMYNETENRHYQYYPTTGRWGVYHYQKRPSKHYHSRSIEDFLNRFFFKGSEMQTDNRARVTDPTTSKEAAKSVDEFSSRHYKIIVACLKKYGSLGKDGIWELVELDKQQVARRLHELQRAGLIELTGKEVLSASGRKEREWRAT